MTKNQKRLMEIALEMCVTNRIINKNFGIRINQLIESDASPEQYAPLVNDHANQTSVLNKILYTVATWESEWRSE